MKKRVNPNLGLAKCSPPNQTCKKEATFNIRSTISSYFSNSKNSSYSMSDSLDSPYKNSLSEIKLVSLSDDFGDFKTPKRIKKVNKLIGSKQPKVRMAKKKINSKNSILKHTKDNFMNMDINPDHLQMALALSKSTFAVENPDESKKISEELDLPTFNTSGKIPRIGTTLERFGFKTNKPKFETANKANFIEEQRRRKNSKFRFITPILSTRTDEDRKSLIETKVSIILNENGYSPFERTIPRTEIFSDTLRKYYVGENGILNVEFLTLDELKNYRYYIHACGISPSNSVCGCLLRSWDEIPGREKSPDRSASLTKEKVTENNCNDSVKEITSANLIAEETGLFLADVDANRLKNCASPDLFDSDYESFSPKASKRSLGSLNVSSEKSPGSLISIAKISENDRLGLTKLFKTDIGIEHFESFSADVNSVSKEVYQLTQSSNTETINLRLAVSQEENFIDLTQSSSSDDDGYGEEGGCVPSLQNEEIEECPVSQTHSSTFDISPLAITNSERIANEEELCASSQNDMVMDMTQSSTSSDTESWDEKLNQLDSSSKEEMEEIHIELDQNQRHIFENIRTSTNSLNSTKSSLGLEESTFGYNCTKSLNITDYISKILSEENSKNENGLDKTETIDLSQDSSCDTIIIGDEELNYSSTYNMMHRNNDFYNLSAMDQDGFDDGNIDEEDIYRVHSDLKTKYGSQKSLTEQPNDKSSVEGPLHSLRETANAPRPIEVVVENHVTPKNMLTSKKLARTNKSSEKGICKYLDISTPDNNLIIKTRNITPEPNYDEMDSPKINKELNNFGLKPLSRQRAIQMLNYIYERTHPFVDASEIEDVELSDQEKEERFVKKRNRFIQKQVSVNNSVKNITMNRQECGNNDAIEDLEIVENERAVQDCSNVLQESVRSNEDGYSQVLCGISKRGKLTASDQEDDEERIVKRRKRNKEKDDVNKLPQSVSNNVQNLVNIDKGLILPHENCEDLIFQRKLPAKISSCHIPLQIVWHNFLACNQQLKENILLYEPLQLEVVHSMLREQAGCKFHIEDLITFLDRKCITFRTTQQQGPRLKKIIRNKKIMNA